MNVKGLSCSDILFSKHKNNAFILSAVSKGLTRKKLKYHRSNQKPWIKRQTIQHTKEQKDKQNGRQTTTQKKLDIGQHEYHYKLGVNTGSPEGFDVFSDSQGFVGLCFNCIFNLCCLVLRNEILKRNTKTNTHLSIFFCLPTHATSGYLIIYPVTGGIENLSGDIYWLYS